MRANLNLWVLFLPLLAASGGHPASARDHWAYRAIVRPAVPEGADQGWARTDLDHFVFAGMQRHGVRPNPDADRATLLRRVTFDLTGLPPTRSELAAFRADPAATPAAFARVVERLLASPHYGERQGRRWMDLVRYADTAGDNSDYPVPQLHLYRDYIIEAFNRDKPFDRFVVEQLAGDLIPAADEAQRREHLIATGYIASARRFGSVVDRYPTHLTIEDTLDNLGRTFLGLNLTCARCHDHKFEAISMRDYYGLYGIFASTRYAFPGIELLKVQKDFVPLVPPAELDHVMQPFRKREKELQQRHDELLAQRVRMEEDKEALDREIKDTKSGDKDGAYARLHQLDEEIVRVRGQIRRAAEAIEKHRKSAPMVENAYGVQDGRPADAKIQLKGEPDKPGEVVPRKFLDVLGGQRLPAETRDSGRRALAEWITDRTNPLTARVFVNRVWQWHFGRGLVATLNNFGERGETPSHPELLDWLAMEFMDSGWSLKQLHRLMLNSRTYQLAGTDDAENLARDADNRSFWRANRRRLEAEELRDGIMLISGTLDLEPPSEGHPFPPMEKWGFTQHHPFKDNYETAKRAVYQMTKRLTVEPYWQAFDGPDRNANTPERGQSVTSLQALYFLNDEFVHRQAEHFARRIVAAAPAAGARLDMAFETVLGRGPTAEERHQAETFLRAAGEDWPALARVLLRMNEFLYVD